MADAWGGAWSDSWGLSWGFEEAVAADRGFDKTLEAFRIERERDRRYREENEIMQIAAFEDEFLLALLKRLC